MRRTVVRGAGLVALIAAAVTATSPGLLQADGVGERPLLDNDKVTLIEYTFPSGFKGDEHAAFANELAYVLSGEFTAPRRDADGAWCAGARSSTRARNDPHIVERREDAGRGAGRHPQVRSQSHASLHIPEGQQRARLGAVVGRGRERDGGRPRGGGRRAREVARRHPSRPQLPRTMLELIQGGADALTLTREALEHAGPCCSARGRTPWPSRSSVFPSSACVCRRPSPRPARNVLLPRTQLRGPRGRARSGTPPSTPCTSPSPRSAWWGRAPTSCTTR